MYSHRFYNLLSYFLTLTKLFNVSKLRFDKNSRCLYCDTNPFFAMRTKLNLFITFIWFIGVAIKVFTRFTQKDYGDMHIGLSMLAGGFTSTIVYSINVFFTNEMCRTSNGILGLFNYLQSKPSTITQDLTRN